MTLRPDCVHFLGDKPCSFRRLCEGCPHFTAFPTKVLIIKCRAQGDVLRTTPLLPALKRKYPQSHVTWLTDEESLDLLAGNTYLNRIRSYNLENVLSLLSERFDVLISLDKEPGLTSLATRVEASRKFGFGVKEHGNLVTFNKASDYAYRLGVDDDLKFIQNKKTYQEIIHEMAEVPYARDEYVYPFPEGAKAKAMRFFKRHRVGRRGLAIGLNTGAGTKFETKQWPEENFLKLIALLNRKLAARVFLLGGPREKEFNFRLERRSRAKIYNTGSDNSLTEFAGFISMMDVVVCSDTLAMHLAIALKKKVIALFGPTCPQEIDLYDRGTKIFAAADCAPCYKQTCPDGKCMKAITPEQVLEAIEENI
ncbi:MAG: glycosyltransferase family 9 protein [Clostridiales bacterium]|nr:glycosyltransferase family 9 protein [Clostridiales bacterium]